LAEARIIPETEGTKFRTKNQADAYRESLAPLQDAMDDAVKTISQQTPPLPIDAIEQSTVSRIIKMEMPLGDKVRLIDDVKTEYANMRNTYGDTIKLEDLNQEKKNYWKGTKFDSTKPFQGDAYYQIGKSLQKTVEDIALQTGYEDVAQLNREIGDRLEGAKFLEKLDGQTLKYGKLGKYVFMTTGATLGEGLVGKVLGVVGGNMVGDILMKADVANPVKRIILGATLGEGLGLRS